MLRTNQNPNSDDDEAYPKAAGARVHTLTKSRYSRNIEGNFRNVLGETYQGDRSLYEALGYVKDPDFEHFAVRYLRNGTAAALVDKPAKDAWGEAPKVIDGASDSESDEEKTEFEQAVHDFLNGEYTRKKPTERFEAVDRMSRLGEYALIFLGLADENVAGGDQDDLAKPVDESSLEPLTEADGEEDSPLNYMQVYTQEDAPAGSFDWVEDPTDPRFNEPELYTVDFGKGRGTAEIHHSRVIHVVEDPVTDDLFSPSVLLRSLNRLDDIEKILGSSAEGFWRNSYQGMVISPPENASGKSDLKDAGSALHDQIKKYRHNMNREIFTSGDVNTLSVDVSNPKPHLESQYSEIAAGHDMPQSMLMGNETGERATGEDKAMHHEFIARRQRQHCEAQIFRATIDTLIEYGVLPEPDDPDNNYDVEWPALEELGEKEEAEIAGILATALKDATGGKPDRLAAPEEIRKLVFGWDPERGSEIEDPDREIEPLEELDENNPDVQQQFEEMMGENGQTPPDQSPPDQSPPGAEPEGEGGGGESGGEESATGGEGDAPVEG